MTDGNLPVGVENGLLPAIFGIGVLSMITAFAPLQQALTPPAHTGWSFGGGEGGWGGGDGGGSDGGGGGCGGGGCG